MADPGGVHTSRYIITHVFCPLQLPGKNDHTTHNDHALATAVCTAARLYYSDHVDQSNHSQWHGILRMLENLRGMIQSERLDELGTTSQFCSMNTGDVLALHIRAQNAGVLFRKQDEVTIFESFELSPMARDVMTTKGKLVCSYPGPAIEIPNLVFDNKDFLSELVNFLIRMDNDALVAAAPSTAFKDTVHPRYITELLTGILRSVGRPANIARINKRIGDEVVWNDDTRSPWRRSALWLLIRIALQTTLGCDAYKAFMLFTMCCLVDEKTCTDLSNDLLHFMVTKISRRLWKLCPSFSDRLSCIVLQKCTFLRSTIETRLAQTAREPSLFCPPSPFDLSRDIRLSLLHNKVYPLTPLISHSTPSPVVPSNPDHRHRGVLDDFLSSDGCFFEEAYHVEPHVTLYDVERAIEEGIDAWVDRVTDNDEACVKLEILVDKYSSSALKTYQKNPELLSVMLLTIVELWVALDKIAIKEIPLLADYSPEVPTNLLENLLLSKATNLQRLRHAQEHLSLRHSQCRNQSVFSSAITTDSFAVRFYRQSPRLRHLKSQIEEIPRREARKKAVELFQKNARCAMHLFCTLDKISVHLWPLPANQLQAELAIFELDCPVAFNMWRATTFHLLVDICSPSSQQSSDLSHGRWADSPLIGLGSYPPLAAHFVKHPRSRISLGFNTVPRVMPRRRIPARLKRVCVKPDLEFFGFDTRTGISASAALAGSSRRWYCTYMLPSGPYYGLQEYVDSTSHTSNEVIAAQADCHGDLSVHEYFAFGHLRSGALLQWLNILRELRGRSLNFRRPEVHMLFAQAVSEVGPFGGVPEKVVNSAQWMQTWINAACCEQYDSSLCGLLGPLTKPTLHCPRGSSYSRLSSASLSSLTPTGWTWHQDIQDPTFCHALLDELRNLIRDIEMNWMEAVTMDTISFLLRRLVASSSDQVVSKEAFSLLSTVRGMVFSWVLELASRLMNTPGDDEGLHGILRDAAAICRSTFDVDPALFPRVLHSAEDIDILLSSAIIIHDHMPSDVSRLSTYSQLLLDRDRRLSLAIESVVSDMIRSDPDDEGINLAVKRILPGYLPGSKWTPLDHPNTSWFQCQTASEGDLRRQAVDLNVLDGTFLVNGRPLGIWLPSEFVRHPLYKQIFGKQMLTVTQSDIPGMDYSSRDLICGHQVYFSLRNNGSALVIRAKRKGMDNDDSGIIELIPHEILEGDLPAVLIEGHAHWLNTFTSVLEIRPIHSLWENSSESWMADCTGANCLVRRGNEYLVDIRSQSWEMVSRLLRPLSSPRDLIISVSPVDPHHPSSSLQLSVVLPRYDLSFYFDEDGDLQSRNFRGMAYDEDQCVGTLFGLVNQLVLRPKHRDTHSLELVPRCVLIPDGNVSCQMDGHHVRVEITTDGLAQKRCTYQTYRINTGMGCLTGNGSLTSRLYCAYLHALTSRILPDPLTGRSGTEEALSILRSASFWSNMRFSPRDADLLSLIASTCPSQSGMWYPVQSMSTVQWRNQELYMLSKTIKKHYEGVELPHGSRSVPLFEEFPSGHYSLRKRIQRRAAYVFPFSGQPSDGNLDVVYRARDLVDATSGEHRACTAATYIYQRTGTSTRDLWEMARLWKKVSRTSGNAPLSLQYDRSWLAPDLPSIWLQTYDLLRSVDEKKWFQMLFSLPAMAYASQNLSHLVPLFVAFASCQRFQSENPPHFNVYFISEGCDPSFTSLRTHIRSCAHSLDSSPESCEPARPGESPDELKQRQVRMYNSRVASDANTTTRRLFRAWPCETPPPCSLDPELYDVVGLDSIIRRHFSRRSANFQFKQHLVRVQEILNDLPHPSPSNHTLPYGFQRLKGTQASRTLVLPSLHQLFARPAPVIPAYDKSHGDIAGISETDDTAIDTNTSRLDLKRLGQLIARVGAKVANPFQRQYVSALWTSAKSFGNEISFVEHGATNVPTANMLREHYISCRATYSEALDCLQHHLSPKNQYEQAVERSGLWPRITAHALFRSFASNSPVKLSDDWKKCLVGLTLLALELQRARRMLLLHSNNLHEELRMEISNEGCDGWDAETHPDWLLIQLQGNFLIRRFQAEVANEMISPRSGNNTTMQLNMGEGKSSVIVPIVAAILADGNQLVRVIVPKSLTPQTLHLLSDLLGGLANRRIYYLPISRSTAASDQNVAVLHRVMLECMQERGILVVQPDNILSLKLVSVERQLSQAEDCPVADQLLELQRWLHSHARDILDESDEILDVRSQLVFTVGRQQQVEASPERWTTTQQLLSLVGKHASPLQNLLPLGVECESGLPGSFPYLRIMQADAIRKLISWVVDDIMEGLLPNISFGQLRLYPGLEDVVRAFITCEDVSPTSIQTVKERYGKTQQWRVLLLLRGLLANGILLFAFTDRRWRVDYGLSPARTMLAVPYRAKDVPADKAEFGHPDITIILTCLSYYYGGLSKEQLQHSFSILFKQHDASSTYDLWVRTCPGIPESVRIISGVNIQSVDQWNTILFPVFSRNRETINFYLSNVVFPREAKAFPSKLSSSAWDLAEKKERLLTGFSGTNDIQYLLPLPITQHDPDHQRGTNAKVLSYLLQPENNHYMCTANENGGRRNAHEFLQILKAQTPEIRVLLDVGAQILDLQNHEVAKAWLDITPTASAAIYFNEEDEVMVWTRNGSSQLLRSSPFGQHLDRCVVYLDDAHTRGTDFRFPVGFRAAVTLGSKVTKDRLAQGCMRMRRLGHGHSIMFFAPLEIDRRIRATAGRDQGLADTIETVDILDWVIRETWENVRRWAPHWVQQGIDHESRYSAWSSLCSGQLNPRSLSDKWLQLESKSLEDLYEPRSTSDLATLTSADIRQRCIDLGVTSLSSVGMDEEQERELIYELRREHQAVKRPVRVRPATHSIHQDIVGFVKTGMISAQSIFLKKNEAFRPAFDSLSTTSAATDESFVWSQSVLVTKDFEETVKLSGGKMDDYLRPIHWVLSAKLESRDVLVILSPYEANRLLPDIRKSDKVHLHLFAARVTKSVKPCGDLALYSIPSVPHGWLLPSSYSDQLIMFAGELYLKDYETYLRLCRFLCVYTRELKGHKDIVVEPDGFIKPENRNNQIPHTFARSPLVALRALMELRNKGIDFTSTHVGKLFHGQLLFQGDFDS